MLKSNLSTRVFQVLIDLIQNDLWCVVVLHHGLTTYLNIKYKMVGELPIWIV